MHIIKNVTNIPGFANINRHDIFLRHRSNFHCSQPEKCTLSQHLAETLTHKNYNKVVERLKFRLRDSCCKSHCTYNIQITKIAIYSYNVIYYTAFLVTSTWRWCLAILASFLATKQTGRYLKWESNPPSLAFAFPLVCSDLHYVRETYTPLQMSHYHLTL